MIRGVVNVGSAVDLILKFTFEWDSCLLRLENLLSLQPRNRASFAVQDGFFSAAK